MIIKVTIQTLIKRKGESKGKPTMIIIDVLPSCFSEIRIYHIHAENKESNQFRYRESQPQSDIAHY